MIARVHGNDFTDSGWREQLLRLFRYVHLELGSWVKIIPKHEIRARAVQCRKALINRVISSDQWWDNQAKVCWVGKDAVQQCENIGLNNFQSGVSCGGVAEGFSEAGVELEGALADECFIRPAKVCVNGDFCEINGIGDHESPNSFVIKCLDGDGVVAGSLVERVGPDGDLAVIVRWPKQQTVQVIDDVGISDPDSDERVTCLGWRRE